MQPNFVIRRKYVSKVDIIVGPAVFFRLDDEGSEVSLTLTDSLYLTRLLLDCDASNFILNGRPLSELREGVK